MNTSSLKSMIQSAIPFVERAGLKVIHLEAGKVTCEIPLNPNQNHMGTMYAGAQFTLADITGGALLLATFDPEQFIPTLKHLDISFLKPAQSDLHLSLRLTENTIARMSEEAEKHGKSECVLEGDLADRGGIVVAQMKGTFVLLKRR